MEREENIRKKSPKMRRRSISTDGQEIHPRNMYDFQYGGYAHPLERKRQFDPYERVGHVGIGSRDLYYNGQQGVVRSDRNMRDVRGNRPDLLRARFHHDNRSDIEQSKVSVAESRYSVTDYFRKYPSQQLTNVPMNRTLDSDRTQLRSVSFRDQVRFDSHPHRRSLSQPESHRFTNALHGGMPLERTGKSHQNKGHKPSIKSPQEKLFSGTELDNSISAIDDDNISSVSEKTASPSTASTVDDKTFRKGIATLDANILKLQLALQRTKNMMT